MQQIAEAARAYHQRLGEWPPLAEMPSATDDPEELLALLREATQTGRPYSAELAEGEVI